MKYYELREKIIEGIEEEYGSLEKVISKGYISTDLIIDVLKSFTKQGKKASEATEDITDKLECFQNVDYVNWDDIRDTLKSHLNDEILCKMFNPEAVL